MKNWCCDSSSFHVSNCVFDLKFREPVIVGDLLEGFARMIAAQQYRNSNPFLWRYLFIRAEPTQRVIGTTSPPP
jgi:hypothetical protein